MRARCRIPPESSPGELTNPEPRVVEPGVGERGRHPVGTRRASGPDVQPQRLTDLRADRA
ncbi:hypothetical protein [Salana multivorans]